MLQRDEVHPVTSLDLTQPSLAFSEGSWKRVGGKGAGAEVWEDFSLTDWLFEMCHHESIYIVAMASFSWHKELTREPM